MSEAYLNVICGCAVWGAAVLTICAVYVATELGVISRTMTRIWFLMVELDARLPTPKPEDKPLRLLMLALLLVVPLAGCGSADTYPPPDRPDYPVGPCPAPPSKPGTCPCQGGGPCVCPGPCKCRDGKCPDGGCPDGKCPLKPAGVSVLIGNPKGWPAGARLPRWDSPADLPAGSPYPRALDVSVLAPSAEESHRPRCPRPFGPRCVVCHRWMLD